MNLSAQTKREMRSSLLDVIETEPVDVVKNYSLKQEIAYLYQLLPKILSSREQEIVTSPLWTL